ncbi:MAG: T9SS type A sorting domain-containing protein [Flavobacteriia bacterium]|nr:T9SS type A sorting domain-containing protein [Flavobacteriia bacterium]
MKKNYILIVWLTVTSFIIAQTAPQITATDCKNDQYVLYDKLNEGKVIVIGWPMPCSSCASPLLEVNNSVINFAISHPNKVEFWLADDFANTSCSSLTTWSMNTGLSMAIEFSTSAINMDDFGSYGMPKAVVIGCNGKVYYNVNTTPNESGVTAAVNEAFNEINAGCLNSIQENSISQSFVFPNPTIKNSITVSWIESLKVDNIQLINIDGKIIKNSPVTLNTKNIDLDLNDLQSGVYQIYLMEAGRVKDIKKCIKN